MTDIDTATLIVGAGPAGLAVAASLTVEHQLYRLLDRADATAAAWRGHYERLHLHTVAKHSALPFVPFPKSAGRYPSREAVVAYLDDYVRRFGMDPDLGVEVVRARREGERWTVEARHASGPRTYRAPSLVIATGYNGVPYRPTFAGEEAFKGEVIHSSAYKSGEAYRGKDVLVVGAGNTGAEIALDLHERGARPALSIRGPIHVSPRDAFGLPVQLFGIAARKMPLWLADRIALSTSRRFYPDLERLGIRRPAVGPASQVVKEGRVPLIDVGTIDLIRGGHCPVLPGPARFTETGVVFEGGEERRFDAVVLATGFKAKLDFVEGAAPIIDDRGYPTVHGAEVDRPGLGGLYFVGFANPISGSLREIAIEARRVAKAIAARASAAAAR